MMRAGRLGRWFAPVAVLSALGATTFGVAWADVPVASDPVAAIHAPRLYDPPPSADSGATNDEATDYGSTPITIDDDVSTTDFDWS